jgi:two-component system chemotaxis family response regulator WspR
MAGDEVLKKVAHTIASCCDRSTDLAARFGGEEFTVVLPATPLAGARLVAEKIRRSIEGLHIPHRDSVTSEWLTASVGIATLVPDRLDRYTQIIDAADRGLYNAKRQGRNRVMSRSDD